MLMQLAPVAPSLLVDYMIYKAKVTLTALLATEVPCLCSAYPLEQHGTLFVD